MYRIFRYILPALLLFALVFLHPVFRVSVDGQALEGVFTRAQLREAQVTAQEAAEELCLHEARLPPLRAVCRLRLRPADGSTGSLVEALLRRTPGIVLADGVRVNGIALGTVTDGQELFRLLQETIRRERPDGAAVGSLGGTLQIRPVFSRAGTESGCRDMILHITALAPVFYLDSQGKLV